MDTITFVWLLALSAAALAAYATFKAYAAERATILSAVKGHGVLISELWTEQRRLRGMVDRDIAGVPSAAARAASEHGEG